MKIYREQQQDNRALLSKHHPAQHLSMIDLTPLQ
jgi:hypothetical protein